MMICVAILPGAAICEYVGALPRTGGTNISLQAFISYASFVSLLGFLVCLWKMDVCKWFVSTLVEKRSGSDMHMPSLHVENNSEAPSAPEYCIDAGSVGSFARFINHSCNPNLFAQCVLTNHHDIKLEKVMLFAADTVLPLQVNWFLLHLNNIYRKNYIASLEF